MNVRICLNYQSKGYLLEPKLFVDLIGTGVIRYKFSQKNFNLLEYVTLKIERMKQPDLNVVIYFSFFSCFRMGVMEKLVES